MTTMYEAQKAVLAEVTTRILTLVPEYEESIRFAVRDDVDRSLSDLDEDTGLPRVFEIGAGEYIEPTYVGGGYRGYRYTHTIEIMYPNDVHWTMGMISDSERIQNDLINNSTSAAGVQQRHLEHPGEITIVGDKDDPWQKLILSLVVYYEIS